MVTGTTIEETRQLMREVVALPLAEMRQSGRTRLARAPAKRRVLRCG